MDHGTPMLPLRPLLELYSAHPHIGTGQNSRTNGMLEL